ncbi:MAG: cytochrome c nitrite reductase small subunit [Desulfovibrionaceae bacterium]|nr:cytochrome c nitrite reductase small subunit [Desulfovibrionaceae bacterium]MBF0512834.1 cytochrome c nitrite reductase small subunit [Desulfovibrionaceae bacterium]
MQRARPGLFRLVFVVCLAGAAAGAFAAFGPPDLLAKSEAPLFCASCHVMEAEYEAWFHEGAHRRKNCVECHLPGDNVAAHYLWKSIDGLKDVVVFNSGRVPDVIEISGHGRATVQANCVRCHETAVDMIDKQRSCVDCHRRLIHKKSGLVATQ